MTPAQAAERIKAGANLVIAGAEEALAALPRGRWIGGTSVYFMTGSGGHLDRENLFVTELEAAEDARPALYEGEDLPSLTMGRYDSGLSVILIPAFSKAHEAYAIGAADFPGLFEQDESGPEIRFPATGLTAQRVQVDGGEVDFAARVEAQAFDSRLPLVTSCASAMINVSIQSVGAHELAFYTPVVEGVPYRLARSPGDYASVFAQRAEGDGTQELSCNCILNFLYGELKSKRTGSFTGPVTFGEIAYILLNQTMVRLQLHHLDQAAVA